MLLCLRIFLARKYKTRKIDFPIQIHYQLLDIDANIENSPLRHKLENFYSSNNNVIRYFPLLTSVRIMLSNKPISSKKNYSLTHKVTILQIIYTVPVHLNLTIQNLYQIYLEKQLGVTRITSIHKQNM